MSRVLTEYRTLLFDCDGVVLNSNHIKTEAFRKAALPWGSDAADDLVAYHLANGGISRHRKFSYFIKSLIAKHAPNAILGVDGPGLEDLLACYSQTVRDGLMTCAIADGLEDLRARTPDATWCIVSGGDQDELREIFAARGLSRLFNGGIFGSPDSKEVILTRELKSGIINAPSLFLGDSRYDYKVSVAAGIEFLFISGWSEWADGIRLASEGRLTEVPKLASLLAVLNNG
jgi:phosphoglycolate phosphatase-like HAD superfamily hydrolase